MALTRVPPPPAPQQPVDDAASKGVYYSWHEWFTRLWTFVNQLYDLVLSISSSTTSDSSMMPYYIPLGETFTVPIYKQGLFATAITVDGSLVVDGVLLAVS